MGPLIVLGVCRTYRIHFFYFDLFLVPIVFTCVEIDSWLKS